MSNQIEGFFKDKKGNTKTKPLSCARCALYQHAETYKMQPYGNFKQRILCLGEAPGSQEDKDGKPWQGRVGKHLQRTLKRFGIDLFEDCVSLNSVNCRPKNNKKPTAQQISCCRSVMVEDAIKSYDPDLILLFGKSALESFMAHRTKDLRTLARWRGWTIPDQDFRAWVCPLFHPSYVVRSEEEVSRLWNRDIRNALMKLDDKFPTFKAPEIEIIDDLSRLREIKSDLTAFDYETDRKKPHSKDARIVACGIADTPDHAFVFMLPEDKKQRKPFLEYLNDPGIGKIAANISFEDNWSNVVLGQEVKGWVYDTMLGAHVLDNRTGVTGLKFQVYTNFGIIDYASKVEKYIYTEGGGNDKNRIDELISTDEGKKDLLKFVGYDSVMEFRLAMNQIPAMNYDYLPTV